jgi:hypothetical protein
LTRLNPRGEIPARDQWRGDAQGAVGGKLLCPRLFDLLQHPNLFVTIYFERAYHVIASTKVQGPSSASDFLVDIARKKTKLDTASFPAPPRKSAVSAHLADPNGGWRVFKRHV